MKTGKAIQAQKTKYPVVAAVALIAALVLGTFVSAQPVAARGAGGIQHGINIELPSNPELMSARSHYSAVASSAAYSELARLSAEYAVSAVASSAAYSELARLSAEYPVSAVASSATYSELARLSAEYGVSSARYTDVAKFYVEKLRAAMGQSTMLASSPELMTARSYSAVASSATYSELARLSAEYGVSSAGYTAVSKFYVERLRAEIGRSAGLASNPELMVARSLYSQPSVACSISDSELAASPELVFFQQASGC